MFEVAPSEMLLLAIVAIVVIGPKDLPKAMRFVGKWVGKARGMARHFRSGIDTMIRESELEELEKQWRAQNEAIMRAHPHVDPAHVDPAHGDSGHEDPALPTSSDTPTPATVAGLAQPSDSRVATAKTAAAGSAAIASEGEKG
jgi:sec-independent protein translocase protein TatB